VVVSFAQAKEAAASSASVPNVPAAAATRGASAASAAAVPPASPKNNKPSSSSQLVAPPQPSTPAEAARTLRAEIDAENERSVAGMSPEEIVEAQAELSQRLPAPVLAMLRKRGAARATAAAASSAGTAAASASAAVDRRGGIHPPTASSPGRVGGGASHAQQSSPTGGAAGVVSSVSSPTFEQGLWAGGDAHGAQSSAAAPSPSPSQAAAHGAFMPQTIRFALDGSALNWPGGGLHARGEEGEVRPPLFLGAWKRCLRRGFWPRFMSLLYTFVAACCGSLGAVLRCRAQLRGHSWVSVGISSECWCALCLGAGGRGR